MGNNTVSSRAFALLLFVCVSFCISVIVVYSFFTSSCPEELMNTGRKVLKRISDYPIFCALQHTLCNEGHEERHGVEDCLINAMADDLSRPRNLFDLNASKLCIC